MRATQRHAEGHAPFTPHFGAGQSWKDNLQNHQKIVTFPFWESGPKSAQLCCGVYPAVLTYTHSHTSLHDDGTNRPAVYCQTVNTVLHFLLLTSSLHIHSHSVCSQIICSLQISKCGSGKRSRGALDLRFGEEQLFKLHLSALRRAEI